MDFFSKIFRSTMGIDGQDYSKVRKSPPENFPFDDHENSEVFHPDELFDHINHMFANFDKLFSNFGNMFPIVELDDDEDVSSQQHSLRDRMLKEPDSESEMKRGQNSNPDAKSSDSPHFFNRFWSTQPYWNRAIQDKLDTDLDDIVKKDGLDAILDKGKTVHPPSHNYSSSYSRVSVSMRRTADGKVEEHRTVTDKDGNETTTVTRSVDGKTFKQTTTTNKSGEVDVKEDWSNISPENEADFKQRWNLFSSPKLEAPSNSGLQKDGYDAKTWSIFKKLFGE